MSMAWKIRVESSVITLICRFKREPTTPIFSSISQNWENKKQSSVTHGLPQHNQRSIGNEAGLIIPNSRLYYVPIMQKGPSLYPDRETFPEGEGRTITSSEESSSIPKQSLQSLLEGYPPNTRDTRRYSVKKNRKDYPNTPFGITL